MNRLDRGGVRHGAVSHELLLMNRMTGIFITGCGELHLLICGPPLLKSTD